MAVVINEFEAVSEPGQEQKPDQAGDGAPQRIEAAQLKLPLRRLAQRQARVRAH